MHNQKVIFSTVGEFTDEQTPLLNQNVNVVVVDTNSLSSEFKEFLCNFSPFNKEEWIESGRLGKIYVILKVSLAYTMHDYTYMYMFSASIHVHHTSYDFAAFQIPAVFILNLSVPVVNLSLPRNGWSRYLCAMQCVTSPLLSVAVTNYKCKQFKICT